MPPYSFITGELLINALNWRYATKVFDPAKKLTSSQWSSLEQALILTPSSFGLQPWKFVVVNEAALRAQLRPASWNQPQTTDASHFVVFAARTKMEESDVKRYIENIASVRGVPMESLEQYKQMMLGSVVKGMSAAETHEWAIRQCYIALGNLMTAAAVMGIDTCPLEGIEPEVYDVVLGLPPLGYNTVVACAVGFRSVADKYAQQKKVRFPAKEVVLDK